MDSCWWSTPKWGYRRTGNRGRRWRRDSGVRRASGRVRSEEWTGATGPRSSRGNNPSWSTGFHEDWYEWPRRPGTKTNLYVGKFKVGEEGGGRGYSNTVSSVFVYKISIRRTVTWEDRDGEHTRTRLIGVKGVGISPCLLLSDCSQHPTTDFHSTTFIS